MPLAARQILISVFLFSLMHLSVKMVSGVPVYEIALFRGCLPLLVLYPFIQKRRLTIFGRPKKLLILRGLAGTIGMVLFFYTLHHVPLATAVSLQFLSPIFTIIIGAIIVGDKVPRLSYLFFLLSFVGVLVLKGFDTRVSTVELIIAVSAALFSGVAYTLIRKIGKEVDSLLVIYYFSIVTVPLLGVYSAFHWVTPSINESFALLGMSFLALGAQIFMTRALQNEAAANIIHYNYIGAVLAVIWGWSLFGEALLLSSFIGMGLIVLGVAGARWVAKNKTLAVISQSSVSS